MVSKKNFDLASYLDIARHGADTTENHLEELCTHALHYHFNAVFVNPYYITSAKKKLKGKVKVGSVVSFPLGQETEITKITSTQSYFLLGADELDISLNVAFIKEGNWEKCLNEMEQLVTVTRTYDGTKIIKFIAETGYLTEYEIKKVAELMVQAGADFFKTCSGMGPRGATLDDVHFVRQAVGNQIKIKVAGGISTYDQALAFINAGADRIGTSHAVDIITQKTSQQKAGHHGGE